MIKAFIINKMKKENISRSGRVGLYIQSSKPRHQLPSSSNEPAQKRGIVDVDFTI